MNGIGGIGDDLNRSDNSDGRVDVVLCSDIHWVWDSFNGVVLSPIGSLMGCLWMHFKLRRLFILVYWACGASRQRGDGKASSSSTFGGAI